MPLIYQKWIVRRDLRANPESLYVFGDNVQRRGLGGQALECRNAPNAVGVVTKWKPRLTDDAFFYDKDYDKIIPIIRADTDRLFAHLRYGGTIVWPEDGIGTGLARLPQKAPRVWDFLERVRKGLEELGPA